MQLDALEQLASPAYVADMARIKANMAVAARVKKETGATVLLATKAFTMSAVFEYMKSTLDGTTASGLYEARLGAEHFGKEVHCYSPAFTTEELEACVKYSQHIYFNSISQLTKFAPIARAQRPDVQIGLRVNPHLSLVRNSALYDPSTPDSRFGVQPRELTPEVLAMIDILHVHNLCENMAEDSAALMAHVSKLLAESLQSVKQVNFGGGHYMTHREFKLDIFIQAIRDFKQQHHVQVILEPGGAMVYDAGYLVGKVLDIFENSKKHAILSVSASAHMPDVLEVPYRPHLIGSGEVGEKAHNYLLSGTTCMTGDVIGEYSFDAPLAIGQTLIFTDMMQYSFVKNTTFNGVPLPSLGILHEDGTYEQVKTFGYDDFRGKFA